MLSDFTARSERRCRVAAWLLAAFLCAGSFDVKSSPAQDALFASDEAVNTEAQAPPDAQVIQLHEMATQGGVQLGDALSAFARIKRWKDADLWLKKGVGPVDDTAQLAVIANRIGADNLLRLATNDEVSDEAKTMLAKLGKASRAVSESKERLTTAIDNIDAATIDLRLESARHLVSGGTAAVAALVEAAVSKDPKAPREDILRAMLKLGGNGRQAITQLAIYGKDAIRANAVEALTRIDREAALPDLLTALYATDSTETERQFATVNLPPVTQTVPTADEAKGYLFAELKRLRRRALEAENEYQSVTLWTIGNDRQSVAYQLVRSIIADYRNVVDAAARLRRIGNLSTGMTDAILAADIGYRVMIDPDWGTPDQIKSIGETFGDTVGGPGLSHAIELALANQDYPAQVGLLRIVGRSPNGTDAHSLLIGGDSRMTPLVRAALSAEPRVRFEAAAAIVRLDPPTSFTGSSHVMRCLSEMRALQNLPLVLLVETRSEVALRQEIILGKMGYQTEIVGSVLELERYVARGGDLRMILSKTQLWDIPPVEMIDRVRRIPRGKNVPIVFYGDPAAGIESDRWIALSRRIEQPKTPAAFTNLLMDLDLVSRFPELTGIDRQQFREIARNYLDSRR